MCVLYGMIYKAHNLEFFICKAGPIKKGGAKYPAHKNLNPPAD